MIASVNIEFLRGITTSLHKQNILSAFTRYPGWMEVSVGTAPEQEKA
jgi:hypothetical protein